MSPPLPLHLSQVLSPGLRASRESIPGPVETDNAARSSPAQKGLSLRIPTPQKRRGEESGRRSCLRELLEPARPWERRCRGNGPGARQLRMSSLERRRAGGGGRAARPRAAAPPGREGAAGRPACTRPQRRARGSPGAGRGPPTPGRRAAGHGAPGPRRPPPAPSWAPPSCASEPAEPRPARR